MRRGKLFFIFCEVKEEYMVKLLNDYYLKFYKDIKLTKKHGFLVHVVDAINKKDDRQVLQAAIIYNWEGTKNPSIKVPYYIDADTLEAICKAVQKEEPPTNDSNS